MKMMAAVAMTAMIVAGYYISNRSTVVTEASPNAAWKYSFVEPETKERPAYFEQMKWHPEDAQGVELRAPASVKKSAKNKKSKKH